MVTGSFVAAILALLTSSGVVVSADSKDSPPAGGKSDRIALVGNRCALGAFGPAAIVMRLPTGASVNYSLRNMIADISGRLPKNPPPSAVAEAAKAYLTKAFAQLPPIGMWGDVNVLVAGVEPDGRPMTYALRALLTAQKTPIPVELTPQPLTPGKPFPISFGFSRMDVESGWTKKAPQRLVRADRPYSLAELADVAGLMLQFEGETNKQIGMPVEQVLIEKSAKPKRRMWTKPE